MCHCEELCDEAIPQVRLPRLRLAMTEKEELAMIPLFAIARHFSAEAISEDGGDVINRLDEYTFLTAF